MATVDKKFADALIAGNGLHPDCGEEAPDNPRAVLIVEYTNLGGKLAYGVTFATDRDRNRYFAPSEFVRNPRVYWEHAQDEDEAA